jgi:hypothetical protein
MKRLAAPIQILETLNHKLPHTKNIWGLKPAVIFVLPTGFCVIYLPELSIFFTRDRDFPAEI